MPCYHPIPAWRTTQQVQLHKPLPDSTPLQVPCGTCIGCRTTRAQHWALRCHLESLEHRDTCVTTLTYEDRHLPPTLEKRHLQAFMKRLRKLNKKRIRFFGCGEYGERWGRPHYHVILFGLHHETRTIAEAWVTPPNEDGMREPLGMIHTDNVSSEAINYVANYTTKKLQWPRLDKTERIDPETGELYVWQPPFHLMSRGGRNGQGIGSGAKKHYQSWALYAVNNGRKLSVPRYYRTSYQETATPNEKEDTDYQQYLNRKFKNLLSRHSTPEQHQEQLNLKEKNHYARQKLFSALRKYE